MRDLELSVPEDVRCSTRLNRGKPIAVETAQFNRLGGTSEEDSGSTGRRENEEKKEKEEEEAGGGGDEGG